MAYYKLKKNPKIWEVHYTYRGKKDHTVPLTWKDAQERKARFMSMGRKDIRIKKHVRMSEIQ